MMMTTSSDWRPYEPCLENEFRARLEREPALKWMWQWMPYLFPVVGLVACLVTAANRDAAATLAYNVTDIAR